jgi:hypothetical protein
MCLELLTYLIYYKMSSNTSKQNHIWHIIDTKNHAPRQYCVLYSHKQKPAHTTMLDTKHPPYCKWLKRHITVRTKSRCHYQEPGSNNYIQLQQWTHCILYNKRTVNTLLAYFCLKLYFTVSLLMAITFTLLCW